MLVKPTFINIGPGRSGTSWLYQMLEQHPEICMSKIKETEFFNTNYEKGFPWYENHFAHCKNYKAIGEISNNYYLDKEVAHRIIDYNPNIKLIVNLRYIPNLLISFYNFGIRRGLSFNSLDDELDTHFGKIMGSGYNYRLKREKLTNADKVSLLESVLLHDLLSVFFELFKEENIYLLIFERIIIEPQKVVKEIYDFLGVDKSFLPKNRDKVVNSTSQPKLMPLALLATNIAFMLRKAGFYNLLTFLHSSEFVKSILFERGESIEKNAWKNLQPYAINKIEENIQKLILRIPSLSMYWKQFGN